MLINYRIFQNRHSAGILLGQKLESRFKDQDVLVLGIPKGGVEVAYQVAKILNAELSVLVSRKLSIPGKEKLSFGAVAEDGSFYMTSLANKLNADEISKIKSNQLSEIQSQIQLYRRGKSLPELYGRTVILVDDGINTGSTIVPALKLCRGMKASRVIIATPVSGKNFSYEVDELTDEILAVEMPENYNSVSQAYENYQIVSDADVVSILDRYEQERATLMLR